MRKQASKVALSLYKKTDTKMLQAKPIRGKANKS